MNKITQTNRWNEWFAGITDGDGCFYINKKNELSFEVTTTTTDIRILSSIKNTLKGGSIKARSGSKSVRYRVKAKKIIADIVNRVNGKLYDSKRLEQFRRVCVLLGLQEIQSPQTIDKQSAYLAGLIDSDGSITISVSKSSFKDSQISQSLGKALRLANSRGFHQLSLRISSTEKDKIYCLKDSYKFGIVYIEKASSANKRPNPQYHWYIRTLEEFTQLYELLKTFPLRGVKMHRIRLAFLYFRYKDFKYHLQEPGTKQFKIWEKFSKSWFKYVID